jgi:hypothetical protein
VRWLWPKLAKQPMRSVSWLEATQYGTAVIAGLCALASLIWFNPGVAPGLFVLALILAMQPSFRRSAMRSGWLLGRSALLSSMREARARGWTEEQWQTAELERDIAVMRGAPIIVPDDPGGDDAP